MNKLITGGISLKKPFSKLKKPFSTLKKPIIKLVAGVNGLRTAVKKRPRPLQKDRDASKQNLAEK
ncbi:MAG: hypothetical protein LBS82_00360, partial [Spirochaetaceae bacterium]|nr:hypothetical protein [Spirochaetaceae bacterium]